LGTGRIRWQEITDEMKISGLQSYLRKAYRRSSSATFPGLFREAQLVPCGKGSAEISETNDSRTKRQAKSTVVISFMEASLSFYHDLIDLLDVGSIKMLTTSNPTQVPLAPF
jgi:hypothetical protein